MVAFMIVLNTIIPVSYVVKKCLTRHSIRLNHILLFSVGYWYYWIFPILMGETRCLAYNSVTKIWYSLYDSIPHEKIIMYLSYTLLIYSSFLFAHMIPLHKKNKHIEYVYSKRANNIWLFFCFALLSVLIIQNRSVLFRGYTIGSNELTIAGKFSAILLIIFSLYALYSLKINSGSFKEDFLNSKLIYFCICAIVVLGMGGRLYVVSCLTAMFVMYSCFYGNMPIKKTLFAVFCMALLAGAYGMIRLGHTATFLGTIQIIYLESGYTAFPLLYFLSHYDLTYLKIPVPLLSSFVNLIPSFILPNKAELIVGVGDMGYEIFNPAGALNSFVSFQINFGLIGTVMFIFLLVVFIRKLLINSENELSKLIYSCICAHLTFTFWRDAFSVSLVKCILEFSILIPFVVAITNTIISKGRIKIRNKSND